MKITEKMYLLAKEIVSEYEKNQGASCIEVQQQKKVNDIKVNDCIEVKPYKKRKDIDSINDFPKDVKKCFWECRKFFPDNLKANTNKDIYNWLDTIDKLNRIDKVPYDRIVKIVQWARKDSFWSKNFLSLNKLRLKDKQGVKYIVVFNEKLRSMEKPGKAEQSFNSIQQALKDLENE